MSGTNGTGKNKLDAALEKRTKQLKLLETNARLRSARIVRAQQKKLLESVEAWQWQDAYSDLVGDRLGGASRDFFYLISHAQDIRYGDFWPFWRTWQEHARIRAASRLVYHLSPLARGAIRGVGAYVIGEGMQTRAAARREDSPKELVDAVQSWVNDWEQDNSWMRRQRDCHVRYERDGEYFLRLFPQKDGWTLVRFVDPTQVIEPVDVPISQGKYGIITDDADVEDVRGIFVAYDGSPSSGEVVPSSEIRYAKANVDSSVKRGMPSISFDMLDLYKTTGRLLENMGTGAAIQAAIAFVRQHEVAPASAVSDFVGGLADYQQQIPFAGKSENVSQFRAGTVIDTDAGQTFVPSPFAANVQNFTAAVQAMLRACAVHYSAPEWIVSADASNNSYSSSLTAESPFVRRCKQEQSDFKAFFQWAVETSLKHYCAVKRGLRVGGNLWQWEQIRHYVDLQVTPGTVETRDRVQESQLNSTYNQMGVKSPQTIAQEQGLDFEREQKNLKEFKRDNPEQGQPGASPSDNPLAALAGGAQPAQGEQQPAPDQGADQQAQGDQTQQQPADAQPSPADATLADAGLDDLLDSLDVPETAEEAPEGGDGEEGAEGSHDLRATVGGLNALKDLQAAVYGGELPREAAVANAKLMLGFTDEEAGSLFPDVRPENTADDAKKGGGKAQGPPSPVDEAMGVVESILGAPRAGTPRPAARPARRIRSDVEEILESIG